MINARLVSYVAFFSFGGLIILVSLMYYLEYRHDKKQQEEIVNVKSSFYEENLPVLNDENLWTVMLHWDIKHRGIVYAQAILETGYFTSELCREKNNLFGLYDSRKGEFMEFDHWAESVEAYYKYVQFKYDPVKDATYFDFLKRIGYAEDPKYIDKLIEITNKNKLKVKIYEEY